MIHYHGTPISPASQLYELAGRFFCVSHERPDNCRQAHEIGQGVMLDNGAYTVWKQGGKPRWDRYYAWADRWLDHPNTWAVIPDVIGGGEPENNALIQQWPHGDKGAPVWHMDESLSRLLSLIDHWPRVCIGSSDRYSVVMSEAWERRMDEVWNRLAARYRRTPNIHMLRGLQCAGKRWPFASADSTDVARNHQRDQNTVRILADRWDSCQTPGRWEPRPEQVELAL